MRIVIRLFLIVVVAALLLQMASCHFLEDDKTSDLAVYPEKIVGEPKIRILVKDFLEQIMLEVSGKYEIRAVPHDTKSKPEGWGRGPVTVKVLPSKGGIKLGSMLAPYAKVAIIPLEGCSIKANGVEYGGGVTFIRVIPDSGQKPYLRMLVNINIERYLVGVVPNEMPSYWHVEALRAQCVCARTYALYKIRTRRRLDFDVRNTSASQVWKPSEKGSPLINTVVNSTRGTVLTDSYRLFPAYFSAECGGATKDGVNVFISRHIAPLTGVKCEYCSGKKGARNWKYEIALTSLTMLLKKEYPDIGNVKKIRALDENRRIITESARVYDIAVIHSGKGANKVIPAMTFRRIVGTAYIKSTWFETYSRNGTVYFSGKGNGHGVGLCQYGARYMAKQGKTYKEILNHYYQNNILVRLW
jgi:stage II sporulation protein D